MTRILMMALLIAPSLQAQLGGLTKAEQPITLAEAVARGRGAGVQNTLAQIGTRIADAKASQRAADLRPAVTGSVAAARQTVNLDEFGIPIGTGGVTDPFSIFRARASASLLLFDPPTWERVRISRDSLSAAGLDAKNAGALSAALAGAAWLRLTSALETVRARENDSVTAIALRDIAAAQVTAGTAARIEQTRGESEVAVVRSQLSLARTAVSRARLDLARALDLPPTTLLVPAGEGTLLGPVPPQNPEEAVQLAFANRPDLAAEREREALAVRTMVAIRKEALPVIAAQSYLQSSGTDLGKLSNSWNLGVGLTWSAFDGHRRTRRLDEQALRVEAQQARVHELEQQIETEARQALFDLASANEQVVLATERVRLGEQEVSEAAERLRAGVAGTTETTRAQGSLTAARDNLIQARVSVGAAQLGVAATLGLLNRIP